MKLGPLLSACALLVTAAPGDAAEPRGRSDAGQFTIYCEDAPLRREIASFAARTRNEVLTLLGETDTWKHPIVVNLFVDSVAGFRSAPVTLSMVESAAGLKYEIVAHLTPENRDLNLQKHFVRAVLLEYIYRRKPPEDGQYVEPPWWLVEGTVELLRRSETGMEPRFFRTLIETNKLPPIAGFLAAKPDELGPTALAVDRALAMCLVQLLIEQPEGRSRLAALLRAWPEANGDSLGALGQHFPALAGGAAALQKWWTLNLARFAAGDRVRALAADETSEVLKSLLTLEVRNREGTVQRFPIDDFASYLKLPGARDALTARRAALVELSVRANALLRPVLTEYLDCLTLLIRGKTRGLQKRLSSAAQLHQLVTKRAGDIADYLNWYEATQSSTRSGAFDAYLRTADELAAEEKKRRDPIARYLDEIEREF